MSVFRDANGAEWDIQLDAFGIEDVKRETGIDLADISASGWLAVETDASAVGRVLAVLCGEQIRACKSNSRAFARLVRGDAIQRGRQALLAEGADFFPATEWSEIQSSLTKRKSSKDADGPAEPDRPGQRDEDPAAGGSLHAAGCDDPAAADGRGAGVYRFADFRGKRVCIWPGEHPADLCHRLAGECGVSARGLSLRVLWLMAHARRERQRQLALDVRYTIWTQDKFDVGQFVKRGSVAVYKSYPLPDTPTMRKAKEDLEAERRLVEERMRQTWPEEPTSRRAARLCDCT